MVVYTLTTAYIGVIKVSFGYTDVILTIEHEGKTHDKIIPIDELVLITQRYTK